MTTPAPAPPSTHRPGAHVRSFVAFVITTDTAPQTRVRFRDVTHGWRWSCDTCGKHRNPVCPHAQAAHYLTTPAPAEAPTT
jgi:hypothetical protein